MIDYQTWFAHNNYTRRVCRLSTKEWKMSCGPFGFITSVTVAVKRIDCTGSAEDETWTVMVVERHCSLLLSEQLLSYVLSISSHFDKPISLFSATGQTRLNLTLLALFVSEPMKVVRRSVFFCFVFLNILRGNNYCNSRQDF